MAEDLQLGNTDPSNPDEHSRLVGSLIEAKQRLGDTITFGLVARQPEGLTLLDKITALRIDELGKVTTPVTPDDPAYDADNPSGHEVPDEELTALVDDINTALATAEMRAGHNSAAE